MSRRTYLALAGASIPALGGAGMIGRAAGTDAVSDEGALNPDNWDLAFEDDFDGNSLNTSNWDYGWGWGDSADYTPAAANADGVWVEDSLLKQRVWREGDQHYVGNVNSKGLVEFSPPVYFEARICCLDLPGANNAFWAKPGSEDWPPEIDVMEVHRDSASDVLDRSMHNLHYSTDGGTAGSHGEVNNAYHTLSSGDFQDDFHTYGVLWEEDAISHYLDGERIGRSTHSTMLSSMAAGAPFYMMLSLQTIGAGGWLGDVPSDSWDNYDNVMETDWVRVWMPSDSRSGTGGDDTSDDQGSRYFWARSGNGNSVSFEFASSEGSIQLDSSSYEADYWVADDGSRAGGTTAKTGGDLPGFWFDGEITELAYDGDLELYVDDQQVDPSQYTSDDTSTHYFWARSGNGNPVSFEFSSTAGNIERDASSYDAGYWVAEDGSRARGSTSKTGGDLPGLWFDGQLTDFTFQGPLELYIDDQQVDPTEYGRRAETGDGTDGEDGTGGEDGNETGGEDGSEDGDESEPADPLARTLTIDARELASAVSFEVRVSGEIQVAAGNAADDSISGSTASGSVVAGTANYTFSGDLESLSVGEGADVRVDGSPARRFAVRPSADSGDDVSYLVETDGNVLSVDGAVEADDEVSNGKILGSLTGDDSDEYWLVGGDVEDVSTFRGAVRATLSGDSFAI